MAYTMARDYTWGLKIASYDAGKDRRLRPSNQLKLQQEVGELHLGEGGLTWSGCAPGTGIPRALSSTAAISSWTRRGIR